MTWETGNQLSRKEGADLNEQILSMEGFIEEREARFFL